MSRSLLLLVPLVAFAQQDGEMIGRGAELYRRNCAVPYCHGKEGAAGRAPQLAGRSFDRDRLRTMVSDGIPRAAMPGFKEQISAGRIEAIVAYVMSLSGNATSPATKPTRRELGPEAKAGRELFFDATRIGACGVCHVADQWGIAIGPAPSAAEPADVASLRSLKKNRVVTAKPAGEPAFPAIALRQSPQQVEVYDLSARLPVLRPFPAGRVSISPGSTWSHAGATSLYSDPELRLILSFLRELK